MMKEIMKHIRPKRVAIGTFVGAAIFYGLTWYVLINPSSSYLRKPLEGQCFEEVLAQPYAGRGYFYAFFECRLCEGTGAAGKLQVSEGSEADDYKDVG